MHGVGSRTCSISKNQNGRLTNNVFLLISTEVRPPCEEEPLKEYLQEKEIIETEKRKDLLKVLSLYICMFRREGLHLKAS